MTRSMRTMFIWVLGIVLVLMFLAWVYVVVKSYSYRAEILAIRGEIASALKRDSYLLSIRHVLRGAEGDLVALESRFVTEDSVPQFIEYLESEGARLGVKTGISGITLDPLLKDAAFRTLRVKVAGTGKWENVVSLLHALDTMPYASRIERVTFSKTALIGEWNVSMDISQNVR